MRTMSVLSAAALAAAGLLFGTPAAGAAQIAMTPELQKIVEAAKKEGTMKIVSGGITMGGAEGSKRAMAGINATFGTNIEIRWNPGPAMAQQGNKLLLEMQAGQEASSDIFNATAVQVVPLLRRGLFQTVDFAALYPDRIKPFMVEGDGAALRIVTFLPGVLYHRMAEAEVSKVRSMDDFLTPAWKGKFFTTPYLAGFDVLLSDEVWGVQKTTDYVTKLASQIAGFVECGSAQRLASGEVPIMVLDCGGSYQNLARFKNVLRLHIVRDNAQKRYTYLTIPKNAKSPNIAILYALWMSTPEGQKTLVETYGQDNYDYPDSKRRSEIAALEAEGVKFTEVTLSWWERWENIEKAHGELVKIIRTKK